MAQLAAGWAAHAARGELGGDPADEPAAAHRRDDHRDLGALDRDLAGDVAAVAGDHARVRVRRDEGGRLMAETWRAEQYDLLPKLGRLAIPTLVLYGDHEFIPEAYAMHIARAFSNARYVSLGECGHFSYLECPDQVRKEIDDFFRCLALAEAAGTSHED